MSKLYANVTARILAQLEAGTVPWVKPWSATAGNNVPMNAVTKRPYSGVNVVLLWMACHGHFQKPHFLTYRQAQALGGNVRKGEHGFTVTFVKRCIGKPKDGETSEDGRTYTILKAYTVFNVEQCENLPERIVDPSPPKPRHEDERDATIDEFIASTEADFRDDVGGDRAYYSPAQDFIAMPAFKAFKSASHYYNTAFHELGHWTGADKRLARDFSKNKRFEKQAYAAEELVAELCAAFICAEFSIDGGLQHADYIAHWVAMLKNDDRAFFTAASAAQKAADFLRAKALEEEDEEIQLAA